MKNHNNLTDDQIHNAKGFSGARKRSISTKNTTNAVDWVAANYSVTSQVQCVADKQGDLHLQYFCLYNSKDVTKYAVYFQVDATDVLSTPSGYSGVIAIDLTSSGQNSTIAQVGDALRVGLNAHADFTATDDGAGLVTITGVITSTHPVDVTTDFIISSADTEIVGEFLTTDASGKIVWAATSAHTPEGTAILSTGEAGGTKFLREDGDGTCSWQTVSASGTVTGLTTTGTSGAATLSDGTLNIPQYSGGAGDITSVVIGASTGSDVQVLSGAASFGILGGTGITTTTGEENSITIALSEDKKSKSDIDSLTGVTGTNLGTFTGSTVTNSATVKTVIQEIVTRVEAIIGVANANLGEFNDGIIDAEQNIKEAIQGLESHIKAIIGSASDDLGTFTGSVITANADIKEAMQELETFADSIVTRINALLGSSGNDLGTFTGSTIADSRDTKSALQDLETRAERKGSRTIQGVASFSAPDFKVTNGNVELDSRTIYVHTRFSANNLDIAGTKVDGDGDNIWIVPEVNNNKDLMFSVACDTLATLYERSLRASIALPLTNETWTLVGGKCIASGESASSYEIAIYRADLDSEQATNVPLTNMGDFDITGSANGTMSHNNIVLDTTAGNTKASEGDGIIFALRSISDEDENDDYDIRGSITLKFEVATA